MIQTINSDTMEFHHILQRYAMRIVNAGIGTLISLLIVAYLKWEIAVIMAILIPTSILLTENIKKKTKKISKELRESQGEYHSWLMDILKGIREIKLFAAEDYVQDKFIDENSELIKSGIKYSKISFVSDKMISLIYFMAQLIFYIASALFVANGSIRIAEYISIAAYYSLVSNNFQRILRDNMAFQARQTAIERVFKLLDEEWEDNIGLSPLLIFKGQIEIENLSFVYQKDFNILKNLTCTIAPGKRIGIVGESGVGKSTLAHIVIRFFEAQSGSIKVDGQDLKECTYSSVRDMIGLVSQETVIFEAAVKDNICFGADVPDDIIWDILEKSYLKEEIEKLPDGLHTILGRDGHCLSDGQNQRLAIARILYKNPQIVILDEATSSLDAVTETKILTNLNKIFKDKTLIVVSHKPALQIDFDEVISVGNNTIAIQRKNVCSVEP